MVTPWAVPIGASRAGAAHRRAGRPCQDAVLCRELRSADGHPVMVMAVADGHGGARYRRSDVGSRLACERALAAVEAALEVRAVGEGDGGWRGWLERELPEVILRDWLAAVEAHWCGDPGEGRFLPLLYGSTLGLVVMTARWWGHTGLGDWDLVRVEGDGRAHLLEEEDNSAGPGEATCSLCQSGAASLFARRAALHPIAGTDADFALVLCTDGIRKSCASDADFLTLAAWLARQAGEAGPEGVATLPAALDRISREGSGDDVTVAIGRIGGRGQPWAGGADAAAAEVTASRLPAAIPESSRPVRSGGRREGTSSARRRPAILRAVLTGLALSAVGGVLLALFWPRRPPGSASMPASPGLQAARDEVARLCAQPAAIPLALRRRAELFSALRRGRQDPARLRAGAASDPLAALIAADVPVAAPPLPSPDGSPPKAGPDPQVRGEVVSRRPLQALGACPALLEALDRQWAASPAATDPRPVAGASPASASVR